MQKKKKNSKGLSYSSSNQFSPSEFSQFNEELQSVRMQAGAEHWYINVTLKALSQKEAGLFIQFYWDVCYLRIPISHMYILAD